VLVPAAPGVLPHAPPAELLAAASAVRDATHGTRVTFSPKVFIALTMLCRDHCGYCTFAKPPARLAAPYLELDEVLARSRQALGRSRASSPGTTAYALAANAHGSSRSCAAAVLVWRVRVRSSVGARGGERRRLRGGSVAGYQMVLPRLAVMATSPQEFGSAVVQVSYLIRAGQQAQQRSIDGLHPNGNLRQAPPRPYVTPMPTSANKLTVRSRSVCLSPNLSEPQLRACESSKDELRRGWTPPRSNTGTLDPAATGGYALDQRT